ncbi:MAG: KpsF/GutQ family sugar-phosphate isomerase [Chitinophagaceae bacterium]|nr:KpsF/GutQ family sugar-phosphate isomerase [Chitinophagaceae bacterium]
MAIKFEKVKKNTDTGRFEPGIEVFVKLCRFLIEKIIFNTYFCKKLSLDKKLIIQTAVETIGIERDAIGQLSNFIDEHFADAIQCIHEIKGRVIISGIGKSAIIAQKIVATLNSTGTASIFMHAADAIHGDLGMMRPDDIAIVISKSGESAEIKVLVPLIKNFGNKLVAICGSAKSLLATQADFLINTTVDAEACPNNLAPTSSTTAQMVMGDAIAVCLLKLKGFTADDFARFHPGGALGKQLYLKVSALSAANEKPAVFLRDSIQKVILEISGKRLGATVVTDDLQQIKGIITDGDIRRMLEKHSNLSSIQAADIMSPDPKTIDADVLAVNALQHMQKNNISQLVVTHNGHYAGMIHIHDLIKEGII